VPGLPPTGARVSLRYRLPPGSATALTDVIGHLEAVSPVVLVRTRSGEVIEVAPGDVVSVRELSDAPVRASAIRAVEHAAALAWPGLEHRWLGGWFLRAANGSTSRANSAVPLDFSASLSALDEVADWYARRGLPAWLALPERLVPVRAAGVKQTRVMVRDISHLSSSRAGRHLSSSRAGRHLSSSRAGRHLSSSRAGPTAPDCSGVTLLDGPDADWLTVYERPVPVEVLTAVLDGTVTFAVLPETAVGRGAVTLAPDGTRWLGISSLRVATDRRRQGHARAVCSALLQWGAARGATRVYVQVLSENTSAITLYHSMGFRLHHHHRYIDAAVLLRPTL